MSTIAPAATDADRSADHRTDRAVVALVAVSAVGAVLLGAAGSGWGGTASWFGPDALLGSTRISALLSHVVSIGGACLVVIAWLGTGLLVRRGRAGLRAVVGVAGAASAPLLVAPPLFSTDARTYVAIGELLDRGGDPYTQGWAASGRLDYIGQVSPFWSKTPSPYSPLALRLLQLVAHLTGGDLQVGALLFRALAVVGVLVIGALIVRVAGEVGISRAGALWLGVANPVVLFGAVSGAHLDALVAPLLLAAVVSVGAGRGLMAGVLLGLATQLKVTSVVVLAVVVARAVFRERSWGQLRTAGGTAIAAVVTFVAVSLACRLGWGWVAALGVPGRANSSATPIDAIADLAYRAGFGGRVGTARISGAPPWLETVALAVAAVLCLAVVMRRGVSRVEAAGWSLVAISLLSSAFWSWYLVTPLALVAVAAPRRRLGWSQVGLVLLGLVSLLSARPGGGAEIALQNRRGDVAFLVAYGIAAGLVVAGLTTAVSRRVEPPGQAGGVSDGTRVPRSRDTDRGRVSRTVSGAVPTSVTAYERSMSWRTVSVSVSGSTTQYQGHPPSA